VFVPGKRDAQHALIPVWPPTSEMRVSRLNQTYKSGKVSFSKILVMKLVAFDFEKKNFCLSQNAEEKPRNEFRCKYCISGVCNSTSTVNNELMHSQCI